MLVRYLRLLNVITTDLELENLNSVFSDYFWRLFRLFCSKVWAVSGFLPLHIAKSSANKNPLTRLNRFVITSFMAKSNRLMLRTDLCGTPFSMILDEER